MPFSAQRSSSNRSKPFSKALAEIRNVVVTLVAGQTLEPGICSSWTTLHEDCARNHGLAPWLYRMLRQHPECGLSARIMTAFEQSHRISAVHALSRQASLMKLLKAFCSRGIQVLLLKGAYLGAVVYKDPALRPMVDIDILVREKDFCEAGRELRSLGYVSNAELDWESEILSLPVTFTDPTSPINYVDLHRIVRAMDYYKFSSDTLWDNAIRTEIYGREVFYLCPELNLIHMAAHTLNHRDLLRDWLDLTALLRNVVLDWDKLLELVRNLGAMRPLYWTFVELGRNWQTPAPESVIRELAAYSPAWLEDRVICHKTSYLWRLFARLVSLDDWGTRFRYLRTKMIPNSGGQTGVNIQFRNLDLKSKVRLFLHFWNKS